MRQEAADEPRGPGRRQARERAIGLLYEAEIKGVSGEELMATLPLRPDHYVVDAVAGIDSHSDEIDSRIEKSCLGWHIGRLPAIDRAILRLGIWELAHRAEVPTAVIIDEAVELAKEYSTEKSGSFVNGVLDAVSSQVRGATA